MLGVGSHEPLPSPPTAYSPSRSSWSPEVRQTLERKLSAAVNASRTASDPVKAVAFRLLDTDAAAVRLDDTLHRDRAEEARIYEKAFEPPAAASMRALGWAAIGAVVGAATALAVAWCIEHYVSMHADTAPAYLDFASGDNCSWVCE